MNKKPTKDTAKLGKSTFYMQVFNIFTKNPFAGFNFKQVSKQLGIQDKSSRDLVLNILEQLCASGEIIEAKRGKYKLNPDKIKSRVPTSTITGIVDMKNTGKAYIISDETSEDVYIASNNTGHALNGDKVLVQILPKRSGRKLEGQIIEVIERKKKNFVGIVQVSRGFAFFVSDDDSMPVDILIPAEGLNGVKNGQKAIAIITDWPKNSKNPIGEIQQVLGTPGDNNVEMSSILVNYDFPLHFSKKAEIEAEKIPFEIPASELAVRRDFRNIFTCTIDPEDAKDFDDALSLRKIGNGLWEVGVHIADVSFFVKPGMAIDEEAYERGTSVYLVDRTFPMLPEKLSNNVCSLRPDEEKLCFSAVFEMDDHANLTNEWFGKTVIKSSRRYAYEEVQTMIEGGDGDFKAEIIKRCKKWSIQYK